MTSRESTDKIVDYIQEVNRLIHMKHHQIATNNNLSLDQFHLLIHLIKGKFGEKGPTIGDIARRSGRAQNTISERVTRLEEKGFIKRVRDENDRRISRVEITKEGKELINSINFQASKEFVFSALSEINSKTTDNLLEGLKELVDKLQEKKGDFDD